MSSGGDNETGDNIHGVDDVTTSADIMLGGEGYISTWLRTVVTT